jgi:hypothetical protein
MKLISPLFTCFQASDVAGPTWPLWSFHGRQETSQTPGQKSERRNFCEANFR